jgi:hypothetical protein
MNADKPNAKYALTLNFRQRSVLNLGIEIKAAITEAETVV